MAKVVAENIGDGFYRASFTETNIGSTTEVHIVGLPKKGKVRRVKCSLTGGSGAQINPVLGTVTNPSGTNVVFEYTSDETAKTDVDVQPGVTGAIFITEDGTLYHRTKPDTGSDNDTKVEYIFQRGWT